MIIVILILIVTCLYKITSFLKHERKKAKAFANKWYSIGNYFCEYFFVLASSIINKQNFYFKNVKELNEYIPSNITFYDDKKYSRYIEETYNSLNIINFDHRQYSQYMWFIESNNHINVWNIMKPIINKIYEDMFTKMGLNKIVDYPVIHFRCADVPFNRHPQYHFVRYSFYKMALDIIHKKFLLRKKRKRKKKVILLSCNSHEATYKEKEACIIYTKSLIEYLTSLGYEVDVQCNSLIVDFAKLFYASATISSVSSFSFMSGFFGKGIFISSEHNDEKNIKETCTICDEWMLKGYQVKHKFIDDYYNTSAVIDTLSKN